MSLRDFLLLIAICLAWAANNIVSKLVVSSWHVPPLMYGALRFGIVFLATLPWLLPMPRPRWRIVLVGLLMGGGTFALLFIGFKTVTPSEAAVVSQAGVPITTLLSIVMLGERVHWRRALGIALTLAGVLVVVWEPGFAISTGMIFVLSAALCGSLGAVMMKQMDEIAPLRLQAWVGITGFAVLTPITLLLDRPDWHFVTEAGWPFLAALLYSALLDLLNVDLAIDQRDQSLQAISNIGSLENLLLVLQAHRQVGSNGVRKARRILKPGQGGEQFRRDLA